MRNNHECIEAFEKGIEIAKQEFIKVLEMNSSYASPVQWHPSSEVPEDSVRCIVRTNDGATFMFEPIAGKWPDFVAKWMYIPD